MKSFQQMVRQLIEKTWEMKDIKAKGTIIRFRIIDQ